MTRKTEVLRLIDLAGRKGFDVGRSTIRDHWKLIDRNGKSIRRQDTNSAAFTVRQASSFLEAMPDRTT
jgi:hypothetical protein